MAETTTIRIATLSDLAAVDALLARAYPRLLAKHYPPSLRVMAVPHLARAQPALLASGRYYLAVNGTGQVLGAGGWSPSRRKEHADIRHFVTDDRHVRRGIGREIMERIFADVKAAGIARLDCLATRMAVPFYGAMGFAELGPVRINLGPGIDFPAVRMQRTL
ncbi:hypothetical protein DEA8626_00821 [Defluviimonas aquaemixtae]|uniref:N-acetyltransferase domain-containing protein n=1 Tax=Albidovulum aquaemixtae TaxID=1542388 RepID=A0A2R8B3V3_9RHOB|nr:GNAT family N-acetyltransferase [Defluviimonas aquaemixtae]SPH17304.1 hypothetical protein DEA8626_00821 [Defluviimonas aquaemixtae]